MFHGLQGQGLWLVYLRALVRDLSVVLVRRWVVLACKRPASPALT